MNGLQSLQAARNATFGELRGVSLPFGYGDFAGEVEAIKHGLGVLDLAACGLLLVRGTDAAAFLQGITTNDQEHLAPGKVQPDLICTTKGHILYPLEVVRLSPEQFLLVTEPDQLEPVAGHLEHYHIREAVELGRAPLARVDVLGPDVPAALAALGHDPAAPLGSFQGAPAIVLDFPLGPVPRAMALLGAAMAPAWVEALLGQTPQGRLVGYEAFDEVRIQAGFPRFGPDYGAEMLPAEAALYNRLSFTKGCYVGQEVHARLHYRGQVNRKLMGVALPEAAAEGLAPGAPLYLEGQEVGTLTSLARLPVEGRRRGIALMRFKQVAQAPLLATRADGPAEVPLFALATDLGAGRA